MANFVENLLKIKYGIAPLELTKYTVGAGSNTYFVRGHSGKFVLKNPAVSEINNPTLEPELCGYLLSRGVPASQFVRNISGEIITETEQGVFHLQRFIDGDNYALNCAPAGFMEQSAKMLGRIHRLLKDYPPLPEGIGRGFFLHMTPENAARSYAATMEKAVALGDSATVSELETRLRLLKDFPCPEIHIDRFTTGNTHGDYFISQIIADGSNIRAVIDWTTACVHPLVWEVIRSFVYGAPSCREGKIDIPELLDYISAYLGENPLPQYDLVKMPELFYYQLAVCDYYNQYYCSTAANREIYLHQARFSTRLMVWLTENMEQLQAAIKRAVSSQSV